MTDSSYRPITNVTGTPEQTPTALSVLDYAQDDDRLWFERHAGVAYRIRRPFPGEMEEMAAKLHAAPLTRQPPGYKRVMLIHQLAPGARIKRSMLIPQHLSLAEGNRHQAVLAAMLGDLNDVMPGLEAVADRLKGRSS